MSYRLRNPGSLIQPWALNGRARIGASAQATKIRAQDAAALTQTKQEIGAYFINTACSLSNSLGRCQIYYQFAQVLAQSNVSDWAAAAEYQLPNFFLDRAQGDLPIVDVALIPEAGKTVISSGYGMPLFTSRGAPTQHAQFTPAQFDIEIDFKELQNALRIASALALRQPIDPDAACAQCVQVFGASWNDPKSWMLFQLVFHQEIYDASRNSGEILGSYAWLYGGAAPDH
jgi:hypothetical protein